MAGPVAMTSPFRRHVTTGPAAMTSPLHYVDGRRVEALNEGTLPVLEPHTGKHPRQFALARNYSSI